MIEAQDGMTEQLVDVGSRFSDNPPERLRFTGKELARGDGIEIYLTTAGQVLAVGEEYYDTYEDAEAFAEMVSDPSRGSWGRDGEMALGAAAAELGLPRVVDID